MIGTFLLHLEADELQARVKELSQKLETSTRTNELLGKWFIAFMEIEDFIMQQGILNGEDIDLENPANTILNSLKRFFEEHSYNKCIHTWCIIKEHEPGKRVCTEPGCNLIQIWNQNGYWDNAPEKENEENQ